MNTPTSGSAAALAEALDRFIALSECGLRACDSQDPAALLGALDARELVTLRLSDLARQVHHSRSARDAWGAASHRTLEASRLSRELAERATLLRDDIRRQIERVNHDDAALGAYAASGPRAAQLDLKR